MHICRTACSQQTSHVVSVKCCYPARCSRAIPSHLRWHKRQSPASRCCIPRQSGTRRFPRSAAARQPAATLVQELRAGVQEGGFCASLFKCSAGQFFGRGFRRGFQRPCPPSLAPVSPGTDVAAAAGLGTVHPPRARRS